MQSTQIYVRHPARFGRIRFIIIDNRNPFYRPPRQIVARSSILFNCRSQRVHVPNGQKRSCRGSAAFDKLIGRNRRWARIPPVNYNIKNRRGRWWTKLRGRGDKLRGWQNTRADTVEPLKRGHELSDPCCVPTYIVVFFRLCRPSPHPSPIYSSVHQTVQVGYAPMNRNNILRAKRMFLRSISSMIRCWFASVVSRTRRNGWNICRYTDGYNHVVNMMTTL